MFAFAWKRDWKFLGGIGMGLCATGVASFLIELSHWVIAHHWSSIASFPILMLVLWILWVVMFVQVRKEKRVQTATESIKPSP